MIKIDSKENKIIVEQHGYTESFAFDSSEAFRIISDLWLRIGWDNKYVYSFSWLGRPIIQLPEDMIRIQEVIFEVQPDVIIETGVAHGGSLVYYASLLQNMRRPHPRVIGVDIEIRPHNRQAIESHKLSELIYLIESNSTHKDVLTLIQNHLKPTDKIMVILDSNHTLAHVSKELSLYAPLISLNSYIVVTDGIMKDLAEAPRTQPDWKWNNPHTALQNFIAQRSDFEIIEPIFPFNESQIDFRLTYWPSAFLKRIAPDITDSLNRTQP